MYNIFLTLLIGAFSSLVAGVILMWKGDRLVNHLKKRPTKRRVFMYSQAYLIALHAHPYYYLHFFGLVFLKAILFLNLLGYITATVIVFIRAYGGASVSVDESFRVIRDSLHLAHGAVFEFWMFAGFALISACATPRVYTCLSIDELVPYAHRDVERLRECVAKCGTRTQYLAYTDAEHGARTLSDLKALIAQAKSIIGDHPCQIADDMLNGITDES